MYPPQHDLDHQGVSNAQLVKEGVDIAGHYGNRSVAEQNSLDMSWDLMMESRFDEFRAYVFPTTSDLARFRQLVVNAVMSTDIVDKELKDLRNARWYKAFNKDGSDYLEETNKRDEVNRKATIVIEHIIQASDISHTMQHWNVYRKWNQNLFEELYVAYLNGRMDKDPSDFWYQGEFGFFDFCKCIQYHHGLYAVFAFFIVLHFLTPLTSFFEFCLLVCRYYPINKEIERVWCVWCIIW